MGFEGFWGASSVRHDQEHREKTARHHIFSTLAAVSTVSGGSNGPVEPTPGAMGRPRPASKGKVAVFYGVVFSVLFSRPLTLPVRALHFMSKLGGVGDSGGQCTATIIGNPFGDLLTPTIRVENQVARAQIEAGPARQCQIHNVSIRRHSCLKC